MTLAAKSLTALLEDFRSSAPTPGGGSAAALAGALGASLFAMVAGLPKPRAASDDERQALAAIGDRATTRARELEALVDRDSEAYGQVVAAYKRPKGTAEEKASRSAHIQEAMRAATETPLAVMRACAAALADGRALLDLGNTNAASDVGVGVELLRAGLRGARLNVEINLGGITDEAYTVAVRRDVERLISESGAGGAPTASA